MELTEGEIMTILSWRDKVSEVYGEEIDKKLTKKLTKRLGELQVKKTIDQNKKWRDNGERFQQG